MHVLCSRLRNGCLRSSKSLTLILTPIELEINSNLVPFLSCTVSELWRLISRKLRISLPHSHLMPSLGVNPFECVGERFTAKTRVLGLSIGEDVLILASVVLTHYQRVTDRQTDISIVANTKLCVADVHADVFKPFSFSLSI